MTANTTKSKKGKGRRFQDKIAQDIREKFCLPKEDVEGNTMGNPGADIRLSNRAREHFPYYVECKHWETTDIWRWLRQAETGAKKEGNDRPPIVVFRYNTSRSRGNNYVLIGLHDMARQFPTGCEIFNTTYLTGKKASGNVTILFEKLRSLHMEKNGKPVCTILLNREHRAPNGLPYMILRWEDFLSYYR